MHWIETCAGGLDGGERRLEPLLQAAGAQIPEQAVVLGAEERHRRLDLVGDRHHHEQRLVARNPLSEEQLRHRHQVIELLHEHRGNVSAVARAIGKDRKQVQCWLERYVLDPEQNR